MRDNGWLGKATVKLLLKTNKMEFLECRFVLYTVPDFMHIALYKQKLFEGHEAPDKSNPGKVRITFFKGCKLYRLFQNMASS